MEVNTRDEGKEKIKSRHNPYLVNLASEFKLI